MLYWIELYAFDNGKKDFGIGEMLKSIAGRVDGFVILFSDIAFYHAFEDNGREYTLSLIDSVYGGASRDMEREDLLWTNRQLKGLISALHSAGLKAFATVFDPVSSDRCAELFNENKGIYQHSSDGLLNTVVDLTSTLSDGSSYARLLGRKVAEVLDYYDFDGAHLADGISSRRLPLQVACYFPERIKELASFVGDEQKTKRIMEIAGENASDKKQYRKRSDKIWNEFREEWIEYSCRRWEQSFSDLTCEIAKTGREIIINGAWLRDTFESKYRYGMDMQSIDLSKVSAYIINDVNRKVTPKADSCGFEISNFEYTYSENDAPPSMMSLWANLNGKPFYSLTPIRDNNEKWDVLTCCKDAFEAKAFRKNNVFYYDGNYKRITDGNLYCLSTGVSDEEWRFIGNVEECAVLPFERPIGLCWLYSSTAQSVEVNRYVEDRKWSAFWWLKQLQISGMPIHTVTKLSHMEGVDMPLVCFNLEEYSAEEKQALENYRATPIVVFGEKKALNRTPDFTVKCSGWSCFVYNVNKTETALLGDRVIPCRKIMKEPAESIWIKNLVYKKFIRSEIKSAVRLLGSVLGYATATAGIIISGVLTQDGATVIADNPGGRNAVCTVKGGLFNKKQKITCSYGEALYQKGSLRITVPANGVNVIKVKNR